MTTERWIDGWIERNGNTLDAIISAFRDRDPVAFAEALPVDVYNAGNCCGLPYQYKGEWNDPIHPEDARLIVAYKVGGISGGSCWESSNPLPFYTDERPETGIVTTIAAAIIDGLPEINIKLGKAMSFEAIIRETGYTEREYYGNENEYEYRFVLAKEFYDLLVDIIDG